MAYDDVDSLYQLILLWTTGIVCITAANLSLTHVLALRDRRIVPRGIQRVAGWLVTGLSIGLATLFTADFVLTWAVAAGLTAWFLLWGWREGELRRVGIGVIGAALPWMAVYVASLAILPAEPGIADYRFFVALAAIAVATVGTVLVLTNPVARPQSTTLSPTQRAALLFRAIERNQAMGPVSAPLALGFVAGAVASTASVVVGRDLGTVSVAILSSVVFLATTLCVMYLAVPPRVARAYGALAWLVRVERQSLRDDLGRRPPRTVGGLRRLLDSLPDTDEVRPLRIETLATFGRTAEARAELDRLNPMSARAEAEAAELTAYIAWCEGRTDLAAVDRLAAAVGRIADPADRLRYTVVHALALTRAGIVGGDERAIDHLASVQPQLGEPATALTIPYAWMVVALVLAFATFGVVTAALAASAPA